MSRIKGFIVSFVVMGLVASAVFASTNVSRINWLDKTTFVIGDRVQATKPSKKWDTQKTKDRNSPYKFVLHRIGPNPKCVVHFDEQPAGKTAHAYASSELKPRLRMRGMKVERIIKRVVAGRNVAWIAALDPSQNHRYLIGAWRNKSWGFNLECDAAAQDFGVFEPMFRNFINSVRIKNEH